jgi:hypothetical protein
MKLLIAPEAGTFAGVKYDQGFKIDGSLKVFGVNCSLSVSVTSRDFLFGPFLSLKMFVDLLKAQIHFLVVSGSGSLPFASLTLTTSDELMWSPEMKQMWLREYENSESQMAPQFFLIGVKKVSIEDWGLTAISQNHNPKFSMEFSFFGKGGRFSTELPIGSLWGGFHDFFVKFIKHIFVHPGLYY